MDKKLIIFDFFGVISSEIAPIWLRKYFVEEEAKKIKTEIVSKVDSGEITEMELYTQLGNLAGVTAESVLKDWMDLVKINDTLVNFIKTLREKYKVILLSNASDTFLRRILNKYELDELFDEIIISSEVKLVKPGREIYQLALDKIGVRPEDSVMVDDNIVNVNGAEQVGISGILYTSVEELKEKIEPSLFHKKIF